MTEGVVGQEGAMSELIFYPAVNKRVAQIVDILQASQADKDESNRWARLLTAQEQLNRLIGEIANRLV